MQEPRTVRTQAARPPWWHHGTVIFGLILQVVAFMAFAEALGVMGVYLSLIPSVLAASFFGVPVGLATAAVTALVVQPLLLLLFGQDVAGLFITPAGVIGLATTFALATILGIAHGLRGTVSSLRQELAHLDRTDLLTNLLNRKALMEAGDREMKRAVRAKNDVVYYLGRRAADTSEPRTSESHKSRCTIDDYLGVFSCAVVDIDHFKRVNEEYGTVLGDEVLQKLAHLLTREECLRESDVAGRLSGEEFLVLLTGTSSRNAVFPMERLRCRMEAHIFRDSEGKTFNVTISCGISQLRSDDKDMDDMLRRATAALTYGKEHGRNSVIVYEDVLGRDEGSSAAS
jgi:diguanylate cyclase (GGDEF)-like protein